MAKWLEGKSNCMLPHLISLKPKILIEHYTQIDQLQCSRQIVILPRPAEQSANSLPHKCVNASLLISPIIKFY